MSALAEHLHNRKLELAGMPPQIEVATDELEALACGAPGIAVALIDLAWRLTETCQLVCGDRNSDVAHGLVLTASIISFMTDCLRAYVETLHYGHYGYSFLEAVESVIRRARRDGSTLELPDYRRDEIVEAQWEGAPE